MQVPVNRIQVNPGRREISCGHVEELAASMKELGLLNPITIDQGYTLIAGLHRLEAAKLLGWTEVGCTVASLEGLQAELAEIDENFIRRDLSALEHGELLLRRKEIYETLHPATKATYDGGGFKGNQYQEVVTDKMSATTKSFVEDTAEKLGVNPRTVRRQIQTAKNLTPEAKQIIRDADVKITKKAAMRLSQLEAGQQKEAAGLLAAGEIRSVDEYAAAQTTKTEPKLPEEKDTGAPIQTAVPFTLGGRQFASFQEAVADLKDPNKDCSCTPDTFLAEITAFVRKFHREIEWYSTPYYEAVFPALTRIQLDYLRQQTDLICHAAETLFNQVERMVKI